MPPTIALFLWFVLLLALLRFDPAKEPETSVALWVPIIWLFISGSRLPSQWMGAGVGSQVQAFEEGNPLDRVIYFTLILVAIGVLFARSFNWNSFFSHNFILLLFIMFALISIVWSDFPFIAFKRWFRDLGNYLVILVVLSDLRPFEALLTTLRRLFYLLIPLSVLLVKYFIQLAIHYSAWTGQPEYVGAATSKNTLGVICLASGLFFFWDTVARFRNRKDRQPKWIIRVNICFIIMTLWLLDLSHSATSQVCLGIGCLVILLVHSNWGGRHLGLVRLLIPGCFLLYLLLAYGFDLNGKLASEFGRDPTLTGRSTIWNAVLSTHTNPIFGAGYQSFWLGPRLAHVWELAGGVNEAHNGYLELYLSLGFIGLFILLLFMVGSYVNIYKEFSHSFNLASLGLALWTIVLFYNMTESAAFNGQLMWNIFLLIVILTSASPRSVSETQQLSSGSSTVRAGKSRVVAAHSPVAQSRNRTTGPPWR